MRAMLRRLWDAVAPLQPADVSTLDHMDGITDPRTLSAGRLRCAPDDLAIARSLCMVLDCPQVWTDDTHGWRTCSDHAPVLVH